MSREIGEQWLQNDQELVLLLDGLDELQPERQANCVHAINQFLENEYSPQYLVVCSRKEPYENCKNKLQLNMAIVLKYLTNEPIRDYLFIVNLKELWQRVKDSQNILDFIIQPMFLELMTMTEHRTDMIDKIIKGSGLPIRSG